MSNKNKKTRKSVKGNTKTIKLENNIIKPPIVYKTGKDGIFTEQQVSRAISEIYAVVASGQANTDQAKILLSAVGKKIALENLKVRAGLYRSGHLGFFRKEKANELS